MNRPFKFLAALMVAFTLFASPAFAAEYGSTATGIKIEDCRTQDGKVQMSGKNPFTGRKEWVSMVNAKSCKDLEVSPPTAKKEVKVLGGRPIVPNPQNTLKDAEYCNGGEVYVLRVTFGKVTDMPIGGVCQLDSKKTVTLAGH
jgi:hypothetical protein